MNSLDENLDIIDQTDVPFLKTAIKFGFLGGGITTVWTLLSGMLSISPTSTTGMVVGTIIGIGVYIWVTYAGIKQHRDEELGGYITMGRAFLTGLVACIIVGLISGLANFIYFNFIDPAAIEQMVEASMEMLEGFGMSEEQLEEAAKGTREGFSFFRQLIGGIIGGGIFGAIVSGITGAIMKKEAPMV